jgi:hypothetical protein
MVLAPGFFGRALLVIVARVACWWGSDVVLFAGHVSRLAAVKGP